MEAGPITRTERWILAALAGLVGAHVIVRAWCVPTIHDEAMTFFVYVQTGDFLPFLSHWDAGNHLLDTALAWCCYKVFGMHAWALRLPSIAAFVLYAWYTLRWGTLIRSALTRWCLWGALLLFPFLLDFFSLFRGYGIGMAALSAALFHGAGYLRSRRSIDLIGTLCWMTVATFADLGLITLHGLLLVAMLFAWITDAPRQRIAKPLLLLLLPGVVPLAFAASYSLALEAHGSLYYGSTQGLVNGSIASLSILLFGLDHPVLNASVALLVMVLLLLSGWIFRTGARDHRTWAIALLSGLLLADVLGRVVLFHWRGTLYPEDRTALQWALLSVLLFALVVDGNRRYRPASLLLFALPLRTLLTLNVDRTSYWPEQAIPIGMHQRIHELQAAAGGSLTLGMYHQQPACWAFGEQEQGHLPILAQVADHPYQGTDLLVLDPREEQIPPSYHVIPGQRSDRQMLLALDAAPTLSLLMDTTTRTPNTDAEFIELWNPADRTSLAGHPLRVELALSLVSDARPLLASLVCEMERGDGERHYELVPLQFARGGWNGDTLHTVRCIPQVNTGTKRLVMYLWNKDRQRIAVNGRLRVYATSRGSFAPSPIALPGTEPH